MNSASAVVLCLAVSGCGSAQPFVQRPTLDTVLVSVVWMENPEAVVKKCGVARACATVGTGGLPISTIYALMPKSFDDSLAVEALGHELLHSLGATH